MKLIRTGIACLLLSVCLFGSSCSKVDVAGAPGAQGSPGTDGGDSSPAGNINGKIELFDVSGNALSDFSGATLSLENTSPSITTSPTLDGTFAFDSVPSGNYTINLAKPGYGTMRYRGFQNAGGVNPSETGVLVTGQLIGTNLDISRLEVDTIFHQLYQYPHFVITVILKHPQTTANPVVLYMSDSANLSKTNNAYSFRYTFFQQNDSTLISDFDQDLPTYSGRLAAAQIYIAVAMDNPRSISYANEQGIVIYPCAGNLSNMVKVYNVLK